MIDAMAAEIGEDGSFGIVTSTFTTPNQARWIAEMWAYAQKCHPTLKWLETVEAQEDNILSFNQATSLINKYGDDLDGLFGMTSVATPASAEAVTRPACAARPRWSAWPPRTGCGPTSPPTASSRWCCGTRSISAMPRCT